jgi:NAD(P)-dependent dehydrogenase (short-subunit alcohol dehydrogenase family)
MAVAGKAAIGITATAAAVYSLNKYFNGGQNKNFPSLQGKTIVITGGNTGLGFICAKEMVKLGPSKIVIACRDQKKANEAIQKIMEEVGEKGNLQIEYRPLDLNDLNSVKSFAETFKGDKIDILLNNAGIMAVPQKETTA